MKGPTYIDKHPHKIKYQEYAMDMHQKHLQAIKRDRSKLIDCSTPESFRIIKKSDLKRAKKDTEILKENYMLLEKLLALTENKERLDKGTLDKPSFLPKSMNFFERKQKEKQIWSENKSLALRLASISPSMSRKNTEKDYDSHRKYRKNLCKFEVPEKLQIKKLRFGSDTQSPNHRYFVPDLPPLGTRSPYLRDLPYQIQKKEWKIAEISTFPNSSCLMAIPIALTPLI